jgi:2',3'-cyclic-nucleotide 2'-phosphodiesterase (5'-nucleotidase family)
MKRSWLLVIALLLVTVAVVVGWSILQSNPPAGEDAITSTVTEPGVPATGTESADTSPVTPAAENTNPPPAGPAAQTETIILLHTNDFHGAVEPQASGSGGEIGGLVNLVSTIDQLRAEDPEHTLVLDAGDTFQGTYVSNSTYGEVVMAAMNIAGYDAWTPGNHGFDWGQDPLRARISQAEFPALAANLLDASTGEVWDAVEPYTVIQVGQAQVAILGLTYPDTPTINKPQNVAGLDFREAQETARHYLPELQSQADLIIALSHAGYDQDVALAQAVDGIDVIVGGHTHTFMEMPRKVGDTIIVQAGAKGEVLGRLELTVDLATGKVVEYSKLQVLRMVSSKVPVVNEEARELVDAALAMAAETMNQPIGETASALRLGSIGEFALGNLIVDAMLAAEIDGRQADIAFHNNGGIRADLPEGPVNYGQIYAVLPFDNQLMAMDLTGEQILDILEHSVSQRLGRMQVAGLSFRFSGSKPPGSRVLEVTVAGKPLDAERAYRVITLDYLASGGDGYDTFLDGTNVAYGDTEVWAVAEYIRTHSPVDPQVEGRIIQQ